MAWPATWNPRVDYPHGLKLASRGILGSSVGTATRGVIVRITIEEGPVSAPGFGLGRRPKSSGHTQEERKKVKVTAYISGETFTKTVIVAKDVSVTTNDIDIIENEQGLVEIKINVKKFRVD